MDSIFNAIPITTKSSCIADVENVKKVCDTQISNRDKEITDLRDNVVLTSETCQNNRKIEKKSCEDNITKLNAEIEKLKVEVRKLTESQTVCQRQIEELNTQKSDYKNQIKEFTDSKSKYCNPISKIEKYRFYY
jgi:chromosome segregation ATPase